MLKWFYLENHPNFIETIPAGFRELGIPIILPHAQISPQELKVLLATQQPDVILLNGWTPLQREPYFRVVQEYCHGTNAFHVYWSFEDPLHTETWGMYYAEMGKPDYVFTHALKSDQSYLQVGLPSSYLPMACNPQIHRSLPAKSRYGSDIALVANFATSTHRSWRLNSLKMLIEPLIQRGYDVAIWGKGWSENKHGLPFEIPDRVIRGPLPYHDVPYVYASSKIILGLQNSPHLLTRRTFECMATGGFLLTCDTAAVRHHFQPGVHLVAVSNPQETLRQVEQFLRHTNRRNEVSRCGQREVLSRHTYAHRIQTMQKRIEPFLREKKQNGRFMIQIPARLKAEIRPRAEIIHQGDHKGLLEEFLGVGKPSPRSLNCMSYLQFGLPERSTFLTRIITAKLKLFMIKPPVGEPSISCYVIRSPWSPETVERGRLPLIGTSPIGEIHVRQSLDPYYPWSDNWYVLDLTTLARRWWNGNLPNCGICLRLTRDDDDSFVSFTSSRWQGRGRYFAGQVYHRRFLPHLEILWQTGPGEIVRGQWAAFL